MQHDSIALRRRTATAISARRFRARVRIVRQGAAIRRRALSRTLCYKKTIDVDAPPQADAGDP
jgi:hypothetical protein